MNTWTPEEQKAHRKLWVEALRSGKYQQTQQYLKRDDAMCCLGVACDISGLGHWDGRDYVIVNGDNFERATDVLSETVQAWLGLSENGGENEGAPALYEENDNHGKTFAEIADIIESEPEGLIAQPVKV